MPSSSPEPLPGHNAVVAGSNLGPGSSLSAKAVPCPYEDMSVTDWRSLDAEWSTWVEQQQGNPYRNSFLAACKKPNQENLLGVEFNGTQAKRVEIPLVDWLDILLLNTEVKAAFVQLLSNSTCSYADKLRESLAERYAADLTDQINERSTLG
jgi:hypothetical protein